VKLEPRLPAEGINNPPDSPIKEFSSLLVATILLGTALVFVAGFAVDICVLFISPEKEHAVLGGLVAPMWQELQEGGVDPQADALLGEALERVLGTIEEVTVPLEARVLCTPEPNAFAMPGGAIGVTSGLLEILEREDELDFILGHEIGHFLGRDHLQGLGRGILVDIVFSSLFSTAGVDPGIVLSQTMGGMQAVHGRDQELDADAIGARTLHRLHGHLGGATSALAKLGEASEEGFSDRLNFHRSHPVSDRRIGTLTALAEQNGWALDGDVAPLDARLIEACQGGDPLPE